MKPSPVQSELIPPDHELMQRYQALREYIALTDQDIEIAIAAWPRVQPHVSTIVDDFYATILSQPSAAATLRGGERQVERLKLTLQSWLAELFVGKCDQAFVRGRWLVGWRHVRIGLPQVWTATALSRMRDRLLNALANDWDDSLLAYQRLSSAITRLMDLDLALIQDAYHTEAVAKYLRGERDLNEAIIGTTQSVVLLVDEDGRIQRGNTFISQLVCGQDELLPRIRTIDDLIPSEDHAKMHELLSRTCAPLPCGPVITKLVDCNSRQRTIRWFARSILPTDNSMDVEVSRIQLLVGHDLTDLTEAQRRSVQQERLAAIGQTMAGLAHESRNAFQRSQAALETLALELEDRPDASLLLGRIQRANDHLLHLYEEVLQFAKPVRLDLRQCDMREIAEATGRHVIQAAKAGNDRVKVLVQEPLPSITADAFAVEQILRNLIENALVVSAPEKPVSVVVTSAWQGDQPSLQIEVIDEGPGISQELMERVFEPFFSTRSRGTGLGLPIARRLAEAHGGSLELRTGPTGTTAVLILPEVSTGDQTHDPEDVRDHRRAST
jgi:signal transduction histidine kinase